MLNFTSINLIELLSHPMPCKLTHLPAYFSIHCDFYYFMLGDSVKVFLSWLLISQTTFAVNITSAFSV